MDSFEAIQSIYLWFYLKTFYISDDTLVKAKFVLIYFMIHIPKQLKKLVLEDI